MGDTLDYLEACGDEPDDGGIDFNDSGYDEGSHCVAITVMYHLTDEFEKTYCGKSVQQIYHQCQSCAKIQQQRLE